MPAADKRRDTDETATVVMRSTGEKVTLNRRKALGLVSLQRADWDKPEKAKKAAKK